MRSRAEVVRADPDASAGRSPWRRSRGALVGALAVLLGLVVAVQESSASTVSVTSGGLDQGALCALNSNCPSTPSNGWSYSSGGAVSGSFTYNSGSNSVDFNLTLTAPVFFGTQELMAGSFSATGVPVSVSTSGGIQTISELIAPAVNGSTSGLTFSNPSLSVLQNSPLVSGLLCQISATSGTCGVSLGSPSGTSPSSMLELSDASNNKYNGFFTFNVSVKPTPVPLPASALLLLSGLGGLGLMARRRRIALV
jgi:hypothetical protein